MPARNTASKRASPEHSGSGVAWVSVSGDETFRDTARRMVKHACSNVDVLFKALTASASDVEETYPADAEASVPMR